MSSSTAMTTARVLLVVTRMLTPPQLRKAAREIRGLHSYDPSDREFFESIARGLDIYAADKAPQKAADPAGAGPARVEALQPNPKDKPID